MERDPTRRPSLAYALLGGLVELAMIPFALAALPVLALDERYGWTARGRRARAMKAFLGGPAVPVERARGLERAIVEGVLEAAGSLVRVPVAECDAIAWRACAVDGGVIQTVAGAVAPLDVVDATGRARVAGARPESFLGRFAQQVRLDEVPAAWRAAARGRTDEWFLEWALPGARGRAMGCVVPAAPAVAAYRGAVPDLELVADPELDAPSVWILVKASRGPTADAGPGGGPVPA